jgi:preprotein translocase subunit SecA
MVSGALEVAQKRVENYNFEIRKQLLEYDNVMNKQREVIYNLRRSILEGENLKDIVQDAILSRADEMVDANFALAQDGHGSFDVLAVEILSEFGVDLNPIKNELQDGSAEVVKSIIGEYLMKAYDAKESQITPEHLRRMERMVLLHTIDSKWKDHLYVMDQVKDGISLRALGQKDPLVEYKKEGFFLFKQMYGSINRETASMMFKLQPMVEEQRPRSVFSNIPKHEVHQELSGLPTAPPTGQGQGDQNPFSGGQQSHHGGQATFRPDPQRAPLAAPSGPKAGRNDPCPCGSGKKYKKCCGP